MRSFERGIICIGVGAKSGLPPVVALCEAEDSTVGVPAMRSAGAVFSFLEHQWRLKMAVRKSNLVLLDQRGCWHHVGVQWQQARGIDWTEPVKWPGQDAGCEDALIGVFGAQASRILGVLEEIVGGDRMHFGQRSGEV